MVEAWLEGQWVTSLVNTGFTWTVVQWELVWDEYCCQVYHMELICLHSKLQTYERAWVQLTEERHAD